MISKLMTGLLATALLLGATSASADVIKLFALTGGGLPQELILGLTGGSSGTFSTKQHTFDPRIANQGWWSPTEDNFIGEDNIFVGRAGLIRLNDFFTFFLDLGGSTVASATLRINDTGAGEGYPVTYSLYDVSTPAATLNAHTGISASIFNDLGSGTNYATVVVTSGPSSPFDIVLNDSAIADINAATGAFFSIGGTLTPSAVPEPASFALLAVGLAGLGVCRRKQA